MKSLILIIPLLVIATTAMAQSEDHWKANAGMRAFADSLGDQPGAHPCAKRSTIAFRLGAARLAGKTPDQAKASLPHPDDPEVRPMLDKVYAASFKTQDEFNLWEFVESSKCAKEYGLIKTVYDSAHPYPPNRPIMPQDAARAGIK